MEGFIKIKQALLKLRSFRIYSAINILGLALSLACSMFFAMYIHREYTADSFHSMIDDIYAVTGLTEEGSYQVNDLLYDRQSGNEKQKDEIAFELNKQPEVAKRCHVIPGIDNIRLESENIQVSAKTLITDSIFFDIFDFSLAVGDKKSVLRKDKTAVITQSFADKFFPNTNPIGKTINLGGIYITLEGIVKESKHKSIFDFDIIINCNRIKASSWNSGADFLLLKSEAHVKPLKEKLAVPKELRDARGDSHIFSLIPLKELYLSPSSAPSDLGFLSGDKNNIRVLTLAAIIVLFISLFNFINIQAVTTIKRGKELGIRKVFGASKGSMYLQFYLEDLIMVMASTLLASLLVELFIPLAQKWFAISLNHIWGFDAILIGVIVFILPLLTSLIPYLKYRYRMPISAIKDIGVVTHGMNARNVFIVLQNVMTVIMIVSAIYFVTHFNTLRNTDIGFDSENLMIVGMIEPGGSFEYETETEDDYEEKIIKYNQLAEQRLSSSPIIESYTFGSRLISDWYRELNYRIEGDSDFKEYLHVYAIKSLFETYGLELIDGDFISEESPVSSIVVTESALKRLGITGDWRNAIVEWKKPNYWGGGIEKKTIIGVIKDIRPLKLSTPPMPMILPADPYKFFYGPTAIRYQEGKEQEVIAILQDIYKNTSGAELSYTTVSELLEARYIEEKRTATTYSLFAFIAILISSMGLFGLSFFDVQQKYREIALRKVNGATIADILKLLSVKYAKLLSVSFIIAIPIAYWAITKYTADFIVKAPVTWWIFLTAMLITALVSMLTLWWQTLKAAKENPAIAMKRE